MCDWLQIDLKINHPIYFVDSRMGLTKKIIKFTLLFCLGYVIINLSTVHSNVLLNRSIEHQLDYIYSQLQNKIDNQTQEKYPEGKHFANAIFALSMIELTDKNRDNIESRAIMIDHCIEQLISNENVDYFNPNLPLPYGAFYNGWTNFTLAKYIDSRAFTYSQKKEKYKALYHDISQDIIDSQRDSFHLLETHSNAIWPADNLMCIASLDHDHQDLKQSWLNLILSTSTHPNKLIQHDNFNKNLARGSSQALLLYILAHIDLDLARALNHKYSSHFKSEILGIQLIKEFESHGEEDIDSGPIIFGLGSVATIMNLKTQNVVQQKKLKWTWGILNCLGLPVHYQQKKFYLFKQEILFDIFMLWTAISML